jgi:GH25 family lysozyme M1 (1,4-beta-N-acetylmuramidase)
VAFVASAAMLAMTAGPAAAAQGGRRAVAVVRGTPQRVNHSNVGATHSPRLLHELTVPGAAAGHLAATIHRSVIAGAAQGVDVASYQHPKGVAINWAQVAAAGKSFAAIKATEGDYYRNPYVFPTSKDPAGDLAGARQAGLSVIAYAFGIPNGNGSSASPVVQADDVISYLTGRGVSVLPPIMLDIEYNPYGAECYGLSKSAMVAWIQGFSNEVVAQTGRPPILYSTTDWLATCTGNSAALGQDPLWIAHYTTAASPAPLPANWTDWGIWQYASNGTVKGIPTSNATDLDQLNPDSFADPGHLIVFNPGSRKGVAGTALAAPVNVNAYPEEQNPALAFSPVVLPPGLTLNPATGQITGTLPPSASTYPADVTVADATSGASGSVSFTWYASGHLTVTSPGNQSRSVGSPVGLQIKAVDSVSAPPITFAATGLPPGLSITIGGLITGWPDTPGAYHATVTATDSLRASALASFTWTVSAAPGTGPTGPVKLDLGGKCLNDVGNHSANGTTASIWSCNASSAQKWTHAPDGTLRIHGKCLVVPGASPTDGDKVALEPCTADASQQWRPAYPRTINPAAGATPVSLLNRGSGLCLADPGSSTQNGAAVMVWSCDGQPDQAWTLPSGPVASQIPGMCLDDSGSSTANGAKIDLWTCGTTTAQQWTARPDGTLRVHGKCLAVRGGATASGTLADLWSCDGSGAQQWQLIPHGGGAEVVNPQSGLCLADPGDTSAKGTAMQIITCTGSPGEGWRIQ